MDIGMLAELMIHDCTISYKFYSRNGNLEGQPSYRHYLDYTKQEKKAEELVPVVSKFIEGLERVRQEVSGVRTLIVLLSPDEVAKALELAKPKMEIFFKEHGVR